MKKVPCRKHAQGGSQAEVRQSPVACRLALYQVADRRQQLPHHHPAQQQPV